MPNIEPVGPQPVIEESNTNKEEKKTEVKTSSSKMIIYGVVILLLIGVLVFMIVKNKKPSTSSTPSPTPTAPANPTPAPLPADAVTLENAKINGYVCNDNKCTVSIGDSDNAVDYSLDIANPKTFTALGEYEDYININISYVEKEGKKSIVDYKIIIKSTNENIGSITTEDELRDKLNLFSLGNHTESLVYTKYGSAGSGTEDGKDYTFKTFIFTDSNNNTYEMKYKNPDDSLNLVENNTYTVTFDVVKGDFETEYIITSIK